jgi:hypothetical protein
MNLSDRTLRIWHWVLGMYWVWGIYHLIRDVLQQLEVSTFIADFVHRKPLWCQSIPGYCDYITFPLEIYVIIAVPLLWNRKKIGIPEILVLITLPATVIMWLWP